jgi:hypothetical protein
MASPEDRAELEARFERELRRYIKNWQSFNIDPGPVPTLLATRSVPEAGEGYIPAPGSIRLFHEVVQKMPLSDTFEYLVMNPHYRELFSERVLEEARRRLETQGWVDEET